MTERTKVSIQGRSKKQYRPDVSYKGESKRGPGKSNPIINMQRTAGNQAVQQMVRNGAFQAQAEGEKKEELMMKSVQRQANGEEKEELMMKSVQRQAEGDEKEELMMKSVQRQAEGEEKDELMMKSVQRQAEGEKKEELMMKSVQRQADGEEKEELMMKSVQRQAEGDEKEELMMKPVQRQAEGDEKEELMMKASASPGPTSPDATGVPGDVRAKMETAFGSDFSNVKVHANSQKAPEVGALAYTQGSDIHFAPGMYEPETHTGQRLLGHELAHVVQQREGRVEPTGSIGGMPLNDNPALEKEADVLGERAAREVVQEKEDTSPSVGVPSPLQLKGNTKIEFNTQEIEWKKGKKDYVGKEMNAILDDEDSIRGTTPGSGDWAKLYKYHDMIKGHILNENLGGYGVQNNLFPITAEANAMHKNNIEIPVKSDFINMHKHNESQSQDKDKYLLHYGVKVQNQTDFYKDQSADLDCKWYAKRQGDGDVAIEKSGKIESRQKSTNESLNEQLEAMGWGGDGSGTAWRIKWVKKPFGAPNEGQWEDKTGKVWAQVK